VAGLYLRVFQHFAAKVLGEIRALPIDLDLDKCFYPVPQRFLIELDRKAGDDAVFLQRLDASLACAGRQVDALCQA